MVSINAADDAEVLQYALAILKTRYSMPHSAKGDQPSMEEHTCGGTNKILRSELGAVDCWR